MVKVKMLVARTDAERGAEIEVSAVEAERMVDAGQCEIVREKRIETAVSKKKFEKASRK